MATAASGPRVDIISPSSLQLAYQGADSSDGQIWKLDLDHESDLKIHGFANWMSRVPSTTYLSQLSIAATHQSLSINEGILINNALCQSRSIFEQLQDGIRAFDLRFGCWMSQGQPDCLYAKHSFVDEMSSLAAILQNLKLFLLRCPSETVIIVVRNENDTTGFLNAFLEDFALFVDADPNMFLDMGSGRRMYETTVQQARGKVIVLVPRHGLNQLPSLSPKIDGDQPFHAVDPYTRYWASESSFWGTGDDFISAGQYNKWLPHQWRGNFDNCRNNVHRSTTDRRRQRVYATWWNVSGLPGFNCDPWDFVQSAKPWIRTAYKSDTIGIGGSRYRSGLSWFDFYHDLEQVRGIVRSNVGCESLE